MFTIHINQAVPRFPEFRFQSPVCWQIQDGENWAVVGPNGAGKTTLTDILQGKIALKEGKVEIICDRQEESYRLIKSMAFRDIYSLTDCRNMYYQQRWNSSDVSEAPLASSLLEEFSEEKIRKYVTLFHINDLLEKRIIALSSGELRKFLIMRVLMTEPKLLILDNPFIGLDMQSREALNEMLLQMKQLQELQTILVLSNPEDIPEWIDQVLPIKDKVCLFPRSRKDFFKDVTLITELFPGIKERKINLPPSFTEIESYDIAVQMEKIYVKYGQRTILSGVDWKIRRGEKWALLGKNGSGKSTLLSLICGDNPQAYANNIILFDRKRGSGESIWDIKKRIGYLSADMHTYYLQDIPCLDVVASGFFDSIGLYRKCNVEQQKIALQWLEILEAGNIAKRSFVKISYGEQRLVLLARALVKKPDFLILDEPLHGLDVGKKQLARCIIESFCSSEEKTMIYVTHYHQEIPSCVTLYKVLDGYADRVK